MVSQCGICMYMGGMSQKHVSQLNVHLRMYIPTDYYMSLIITCNVLSRDLRYETRRGFKL